MHPLLAKNYNKGNEAFDAWLGKERDELSSSDTLNMRWAWNAAIEAAIKEFQSMKRFVAVEHLKVLLVKET